MLVAVRKEEGSIPGTGFHYLMYPIKFTNEMEPKFFELMGYIVFEVNDELGEELLRQARAALSHQVQVAHLCEGAIKIQGKEN